MMEPDEYTRVLPGQTPQYAQQQQAQKAQHQHQHHHQQPQYSQGPARAAPSETPSRPAPPPATVTVPEDPQIRAYAAECSARKREVRDLEKECVRWDRTVHQNTAQRASLCRHAALETMQNDIRKGRKPAITARVVGLIDVHSLPVVYPDSTIYLVNQLLDEPAMREQLRKDETNPDGFVLNEECDRHLCARLGKLLADAFRRALIERQVYNPESFKPTVVPWDFCTGREMTPEAIVEALHAVWVSEVNLGWTRTQQGS